MLIWVSTTILNCFDFIITNVSSPASFVSKSLKLFLILTELLQKPAIDLLSCSCFPKMRRVIDFRKKVTHNDLHWRRAGNLLLVQTGVDDELKREVDTTN